MTRAPGGNTFQTSREKLIFLPTCPCIEAVQVPGDLVSKRSTMSSNTSKRLEEEGAPNPFQHQELRSHKKHTTQLLLELINVRNYHTVV